MSSLSPEALEQVADVATEEILEQALGAARAIMGEDGETFGDQRVQSGGEFIAYYLDLLGVGPDPQTGVLTRGVLPDTMAHLEEIAPKLAESLTRQYERERRKLAERVE